METELSIQTQIKKDINIQVISMAEKGEQVPVVAVMVPLPAQSHMHQLLQLALRISSHNIPIHYVGTSTHNRQLRDRAKGLNLSDKIEFHDYPVPDASPLPEIENHMRFLAHQLPSYELTAQHLQEPAGALLHDLAKTAKRVVVVHDLLVSSIVQDAASIPNAETYIYHTISVYAEFSTTMEFMEAMGLKPLELGPDVPKGVPITDGCASKEMSDYASNQHKLSMNKAGDLYNGCRSLEGIFIDALAMFSPNSKCWAIGPVNPITVSKQDPTKDRHRCFEWLDKQTPGSVLFVSFGTTTNMEDEQVKELALGLEQSKVKFLWVLRDFDTGNIYNGEKRTFQLPEGFEARIEGQGLIVREWAPQLEIMNHKAIGGFLSHCGWASCMESLSMGVPLAAWPMHSDQPNNALFVTEYLKAGILVRKWEHRYEIVKSSTISEVARKLIESEEGEELRKKAQELGHTLQQCVQEGGASQQDFEAFIAHITR